MLLFVNIKIKYATYLVMKRNSYLLWKTYDSIFSAQLAQINNNEIKCILIYLGSCLIYDGHTILSLLILLNYL